MSTVHVSNCARSGHARSFLVIALLVLLCLAVPAFAQRGATGDSVSATADNALPQAPMSNTPTSSANIFVPASSVYRPEDAGKFMHTNYVLHTATGNRPAAMADPDASTNLTLAETPASLGCVYKVGPIYTNCDPATGGTNHPTGGWGAIAIVDAFDNPNAASDLTTFNKKYGLPTSTFSKVYANGNGHCTKPVPNADWALEESLDIEWAHAMAPSAKIILVEACSNSDADLYYAETVAAQLVENVGGGEVSNSWGGGEYAGEANDDINFRTQYKHVAYFASAGDSGCGAQYPSSSPFVVSAGGTTVRRNTDHSFNSETCWSGSGGGTSAYEQWGTTTDFPGSGMGPWAAFQYPMFGGYLGSTYRRTPDMSFDSDPNSGVYVYSGYNGGWFIVGGTSVASPALAGIVNLSGNKLGQAPAAGGYYSNGENNLIYSELMTTKDYAVNFYDVKSGTNGGSCKAAVLWDNCTGVGSPRGLLGK